MITKTILMTITTTTTIVTIITTSANDVFVPSNTGMHEVDNGCLQKIWSQFVTVAGVGWLR